MRGALVRTTALLLLLAGAASTFAQETRDKGYLVLRGAQAAGLDVDAFWKADSLPWHYAPAHPPPSGELVRIRLREPTRLVYQFGNAPDSLALAQNPELNFNLGTTGYAITLHSQRRGRRVEITSGGLSHRYRVRLHPDGETWYPHPHRKN